ncbi:MAG: hypothetical protein WBQ79_01135, partial [Acidobacteriaceae bacterium]
MTDRDEKDISWRDSLLGGIFVLTAAVIIALLGDGITHVSLLTILFLFIVEGLIFAFSRFRWGFLSAALLFVAVRIVIFMSITGSRYNCMVAMIALVC